MNLKLQFSCYDFSDTFDEILRLISPYLSDNVQTIDKRLRLMTALTYFSTTESFREVAHRHGIADSTAHAQVQEITQALVAVAPKIIRQVCVETFQTMYHENTTATCFFFVI